MEIIKNSDANDYGATCKDCGCTFTFKYYEANRCEDYEINGKDYIMYYLTCPECKRETQQLIQYHDRSYHEIDKRVKALEDKVFKKKSQK